MNQAIRGKVRFYRRQNRKHPEKGVWTQAVILVKAEDKEKLKELDGKEITLYLEPANSQNCFDKTKEELLNALLDLFIAAYSKKELKAELNKLPQAKKVLKLLGGN